MSRLTRDADQEPPAKLLVKKQRQARPEVTEEEQPADLAELRAG